MLPFIGVSKKKKRPTGPITRANKRFTKKMMRTYFSLINSQEEMEEKRSKTQTKIKVDVLRSTN